MARPGGADLVDSVKIFRSGKAQKLDSITVQALPVLCDNARAPVSPPRYSEI